MRGRGSFSGAGLMLTLLLVSSPALAQITTGTVSGNVKDAPGARDPNLRADTYTAELTLEALTTVRRTAVAVSRGAHVGIPPLTLEPDTLARTVTALADSPMTCRPGANLDGDAHGEGNLVLV